jgi:hypothetical protein
MTLKINTNKNCRSQDQYFMRSINLLSNEPFLKKKTTKSDLRIRYSNCTDMDQNWGFYSNDNENLYLLGYDTG